jgi:glycogen synthase
MQIFLLVNFWIIGGLGDVASALPKALARRGHRVMVNLFEYRLIIGLKWLCLFTLFIAMCIHFLRLSYQSMETILKHKMLGSVSTTR